MASIPPLGTAFAIFACMDDLEIELKAIMVKLIVRYPDGLERIESCLSDVIEAGIEMCDESKVIH